MGLNTDVFANSSSVSEVANSVTNVTPNSNSFGNDIVNKGLNQSNINTGYNEYTNEDSHLNSAQREANRRMNNKKREPMVIEYYKGLEYGANGNAEPITDTVEMYINPQRMHIQKQKIKGKKVTRGGIFYHHYGDDHPTLQIEGNVGLSGMKGIEQLDKIYKNSGTLLKYGDVSDNNTVTRTNTINLEWDWGNLKNPATLMKIAQKYPDLSPEQISNGLLSMGKSLASSSQEILLAQAAEKSHDTKQQVLESRISEQETIIKDAKLSTLRNTSMELGDKVDQLCKLGKTFSLDLLQEFVDVDVTVGEMHDSISGGGWDDMQDELEDPWRPRQIFLYFEDKVYIGHFDNFNYTRLAETPLIKYNMSFTVIRELKIKTKVETNIK
jgi:hypothetical protein